MHRLTSLAKQTTSISTIATSAFTSIKARSSTLSMEQLLPITYLKQQEAQDSDTDLMSSRVGYSIDILMEHAGLAIAHSIHAANEKYHESKITKVLVICGPGNNGGDGVVAARHLATYNGFYKPSILLLRQPTKEFFVNQITTCQEYEIPVKTLQDLSGQPLEGYLNEFDLVVDALFGFSFVPPVKQPSDQILEAMKQTKSPVFSVDIPSGWHVEQGNVNNFFEPQYLISLTLPKLGVQGFKGKHYVGGRFVPTSFAKKYNWVLPQYPGNQTFVELN